MARKSTPQFVMDNVNLLFRDLTTPEMEIKFNPPSRSDPSTIENSIHPPEATWTWADETARMAQPVNRNDLGKYGLQTDNKILFRLASVSPLVWKPVQDFTSATWTWPNLWARNTQPVAAGDVGKTGFQVDTNTYYRLTSVAPAVWQVSANPANTSRPFELSTGASDADSYHDFFRLQIAFEDVWIELVDSQIEGVAKALYAHWDALMDPSRDNSGLTDRGRLFAAEPTGGITGADELQNFLNNLKIQLGITSAGSSNIPPDITQLKDAVVETLKGCNMLLTELYLLSRAYGGRFPMSNSGSSPPNWLEETDTNHNPNGDLTGYNDFPSIPRFGGNSLSDFHDISGHDIKRYDVFDSIARKLSSWSSSSSAVSSPATPEVTSPGLTQLLKKLDKMLTEAYRFDVFAPASINYGVLLNYRQHWKPQSYQVGNLVSTIPLAPQETRRYTTKTVVKKSRNVKEIDDSLRSGKDDSSNTWRIDAEIVDRAKNQTNFQKNVSGSYGNDSAYKVSAGMQQGKDQAVESAQTKRDFHESVVKSAQEYRNEHRIEITTEESREDESTTYREIRNPNDELTVTYLFYELQRRYLVDERLHKATPVILVANEVPAPHQIDESWILRYDWIIKRVILDDSFLPALEYLSADYTGENVTLQVLGLAVQQQKTVVDRISQQVQLANVGLQTSTLGLQSAQDVSIQQQQQRETQALVKSFFDPLGITQTGAPGDGNTDRARVDFAKDALNRSQAKVNQLVSDLKTETTAMQVAIDKYTAAATRHFGMLAEIDRLRIHVKDNIIHYMQAIWTYEPSDQRYFRLYNLEVPVFGHNTTVPAAPSAEAIDYTDLLRENHLRVAFPLPTLLAETAKLHQVADLENLIGFKGNYMIFPMTNFNYMNWFMMQDYINIDDTTGVTARDPDVYGDLTLDDIDVLRNAMAGIRAKNPGSFAKNQKFFEEIMLRLLSNKTPEMVIVPSNSLYIEALPGTHPLLEDFKLIHRAIDVKKAQAEARKAELENLRLGARLATDERGDPDIERMVVVGNGRHVTVDAGQ